MYQTTIAHDGHVRVEDLLAKLSIDFSLTCARPTTPENDFVPALLDMLCKDIIAEEVSRGGSQSVPVMLRLFFQRVDTDGSGVLELPEFISALKMLPSARELPDAQLKAVAQYVDVSGDGSINYPELLSALSVSRETGGAQAAPDGMQGAGALLEDTLEAVYRVLKYDYAAPMLLLLRQLCPAGTTRCSRSTFEQVLVAVNHGAGGTKLQTKEIECLVESLDLDYSLTKEGDLDYEQFFESAQIVDTLAPRGGC